MIDQVLVPEIDLLTIDSIFPIPGRNELCHCGSGVKYKRCHEPIDQEAWSFVARLRRDAEAVSATLPSFNRSEPDEEST